jgi:hypothetical protein
MKSVHGLVGKLQSWDAFLKQRPYAGNKSKAISADAPGAKCG